MDKRKRFVVFHRNRLFRDCLKTYLQSNARTDVTSFDHTCVDPVDQLREKSTDVVLLDLNLPNDLALHVSRAVSRGESATKIIVLVPDDHDRLAECIASGAHGCVLERSSLEDLDAAIERVLGGELFCSPEIVATMFAEVSRLTRTPSWHLSDGERKKRLTNREQQVLELLSERKSNKEIASALSVSLFTVKNHVHNILEKLDVESRVEAVDFARKSR